MKPNIVTSLFWAATLSALMQTASAQTSVTNNSAPVATVGGVSKATLIAEHDTNNNGKIDAAEHAAYARAVARLRKQEMRPKPVERLRMTPQEKALYQPPRLTPAVIQMYDANQNGVLDPRERAALEAAAVATARQELQQRDSNGDGNIDPQEQAAFEKVSKRERQAGGGIKSSNGGIPNQAQGAPVTK